MAISFLYGFYQDGSDSGAKSEGNYIMKRIGATPVSVLIKSSAYKNDPPWRPYDDYFALAGNINTLC